MRRLTRLLSRAALILPIAAAGGAPGLAQPRPADPPAAATPLPPGAFEDRREAHVARMTQALRSGEAAAAEAEMLALIALYSDRFGPGAPDTLEMIRAFAGLLDQFGASSLALRRLAYARSEAALGALHPETLGALAWLAMQLAAVSDPEAAALAERSVARHRQVFGPDAQQTRQAEISLGDALLSTGEPRAAIALLDDLAARFAQATGEERVGRSLVLMLLGQARFTLGAYGEAMAALDQAAAVARQALGPDAPVLGAIDQMRAASLLKLGRPGEAGTVLRGALDRAARTAAGADPAVHQALLFNYAQALAEQERLEEARAVAEDALLAALQTAPSDPSAQIVILTKFAELTAALDRPDFQTETLRAILGRTSDLLGPDAPATLAAMSEFGSALALNGDADEGRRLMETALAGLAHRLGPDDAAVLRARQRLAAVWMRDGRVAEAVDAQDRYLRHLRRTIGPDAADALVEQMNLAVLLLAEGRPAEARGLVQDALARLTDAPEMRGLRHELNLSLAQILIALDDPAQARTLLAAERPFAVDAFRRASADVFARGPQTHRSRIARMGQLLAQSAWLTAARSGGAAAALRSAAFEDAQLAAEGETSDAVSRAAARAAARDPRLRALFAEWERLQAENAGRRLDRADRLASGAEGLSDARYEPAQALAALRATLRRDHPELLSLLTPPPVPLARLQGAEGGPPLLRADEALVLIAGAGTLPPDGAPDFGLVWAISRDAVAWAVLPLGRREMLAEIDRLRDQLDPQSEGAPPFAVATRAPVSPGGGTTRRTEPRPFDIAASHALYRAIFGDPGIAAVLAEKPNWILVGQGEALALPFNALVTRPPPPGAEGATRLRETGWLGLERALLTVPSVAAFAALRDRAAEPAQGEGRLGYVAFGDPDFGPGSTLPRLAGSRQEVARIADLKGIEPLALELDAAASEARLAELAETGRLASADILHFATHGVTVAAAATAGPEPALALTPPAGGSVAEARPGLAADGFLTAAEVAALRLSADWVLLSACNTAARLGIGSLGLRGLTDGFLEAGARNLLVSHWRVQDDVAARLMVDAVAGNIAGLPKAEALRRAMLAVAADRRRDGGDLPYAHPSVWAPFLLVGADAMETAQSRTP